MSVWSVKIAVTWENPLRDSERVRDVRLTALAGLTRVRGIRDAIGALDDREVALRMVRPHRAQELLDVVSARDMHAAVMARIATQDVFVGVAAVADYRPQAVAEHKLKKDDGEQPPIALIRNPDILAEVAALAKPPLCVGFAAESQELEAYAEKKRKSKKIPLIVGNLVQDGFGGDDNRLVLFDAHGATPLPPGTKLDLARQLVAHIATLLEKP